MQIILSFPAGYCHAPINQKPRQKYDHRFNIAVYSCSTAAKVIESTNALFSYRQAMGRYLIRDVFNT